jgi:DNA-binding Lrp family transcriptional regulator
MYRASFLLDEDDEIGKQRKKYTFYSTGKRAEIDNFDFQLLRILAINARMPTIEIAEKLKTTARKVKNRLNNLMKHGVIHGFTTNLDYPKFGYNMYKADVTLTEHDKLSKVIAYVEKNRNLDWIIKSIGYVDVELIFILQDDTQLFKIMEDLSLKFPDTIKNYMYYKHIEAHSHAMRPPLPLSTTS